MTVFDWAEYLRFADELADAESEAQRRSAISRAYYAAYNRAQERAYDLEIDTSPDECQSDHQACWIAYSRGDKPRRKIAEMGKRIRDLRNAADYHSDRRDLMGKAREAVDDSRSLINRLADL